MSVLITKTIIDKALEFYSITDNEYKMKCYKCIDEIQQNSDYQETVKNVYNLLFADKNDNIRKLWSIKNKSELFGKISNHFITNVLLLAGYEVHKSNMKNYAFDEYQIEIHKKRVRETLLNDINIRKYEGIRISQMLWGAYFVNIKIIEIGRLQYEFIKFNPLKEDEYKECIKIHIPSGERLIEQDVKLSIENSRIEIKKYFNLENPDYYCSSWLLSPVINQIVDNNSNISKFYNMFEILEEKDGIEDILNFVFNVKDCNNYTKLEEKTSLQKQVKQLLLKNENLTIGVGVLK